MPNSLLSWTIAALLLFWGVGAYNRLMRLRAEAHSAFAVVEAELAKQVELVRKQLPGADFTQPAALEQESTFWAGLQGAARQFAASLAAVHNRPLDARRMAALNAASDVFVVAWENAARDDAHDLAGPRLPDNVLARRSQLALQAHAAIEQFNGAVGRYNEAIAQFPAVLLAWMFGFKPGRPLDGSLGAVMAER
ncbi:LemA family protein [Ramlibacter sp.]|uniref:LemA family protein n=1 Tax=Ramlibacter sp. TaxID=1917967 RepID=UPI002B793AE9|nr:LemA family protein [Ramlibacter sp.]HWI81581.1 LemA family protein [Ramlibacter sp.]